LVLVLSLALSLGGTDQPALAQSGQEPGNVVATVLPSVTQTDRRALLASFIDRLGPSCLEKGKQFGADPAALAATVWARGFYRTDDISETSGGWRASSITPIGTFVPGSASTTRRPILLSTTSPQSGSVEAFSLGAYARRARVWIRIREVEQSLRLIDQILDRLPNGAVRTELNQAGEVREGLAMTEAFRGDLLVYVRLDAKGTIERCHLRDASWFQWPLLEAAIEGNIVADFPLCNKSFNCSYSGHDL
jgi:hypothetical protein